MSKSTITDMPSVEDIEDSEIEEQPKPRKKSLDDNGAVKMLLIVVWE